MSQEPPTRQRGGATRTGVVAALGAILVTGAFAVPWGDADAARAAPPGLPPVAAELPVVLPVEMNERVTYWMKRFTGDQRATFQRFLAREGYFGPLIRERLRERGMPEELTYLAMIESGFSNRAVSPVGARGMWQFMGPTAREMGLRVDSWVDDRRDPLRATDAALGYLEILYGRYGSWYLAAAAYNAGLGRVDRALRGRPQNGAGDRDVYWDIVDRLPRETREYVPRLLAATVLARQAGEHGFDVSAARSYAFDRVWVPGGTTLARIARSAGVDARAIMDLNPQLLRGMTPPGATYELRIPVGSTHRVVAALGFEDRADD